jgi:hypothetical protein
MALGGELEILTQPITDGARLRSTLEGLEPGDGRASFGDLARAVRSLAETVNGPIDVDLFSDMQHSAMPANFADVVLPGNAKLVLHHVAQGPTVANWTVESVGAPAELSDPKDPRRSRVRAVVAGFSTPLAKKTVSLIVNGRTIATQKVDVPANGRATVDFAPLDVGYGFNRCAVAMEGEDAFPADDTTIFSVRRSDPERVLFVHDAGDARSGTYFGAALAAAAQGSYVLQSISREQTTDVDPSRFAFVVLSDTVALPSIFEHALTQYVAKGGNVLIVLGTRAARHAPIPLWGGEVQDTRNYVRSGNVSAVGQVDFSHPVLEQAQPGRDNGGWSEVKVLYAAVVDPAQARVAARLTDGTPLLVEKPLGEGHLLLFASGMENLTNDLPLHPLFVAFVDRLARHLSGSEPLSGSRPVDSFVQLRAGGVPLGTGASLEVIDPEGRRPLSLSEARNAQTIRLARAGFYQIRFANGRNTVIGVNPDRRESNLESLPNDLQQLWSGSSSNNVPQKASTRSDEKKNQPLSLWWYVMLLALAAGIAEIALASRYIGTQREEA